ncbi:MAG: DUF6941 family protein [Actinomycetota bacterium]
MAFRHIASVVCDYLIRADNGRFTLAGIFKNIEASQFPAIKDPMGIYVEFSAEPGDAYEILLQGPKGFSVSVRQETVGSAPPLVPYQQWSCVTVATARPAIFPDPGIYYIVLKGNGRTIHRHAFGVIPVAVAASEEANG